MSHPTDEIPESRTRPPTSRGRTPPPASPSGRHAVRGRGADPRRRSGPDGRPRPPARARDARAGPAASTSPKRREPRAAPRPPPMPRRRRRRAARAGLVRPEGPERPRGHDPRRPGAPGQDPGARSASSAGSSCRPRRSPRSATTRSGSSSGRRYPGYIMVEMELNEKTWFIVRETPGVGDFVGAHGTPTKMTETEVNQMLGQETAKTEEAPAGPDRRRARRPGQDQGRPVRELRGDRRGSHRGPRPGQGHADHLQPAHAGRPRILAGGTDLT